MASTANDKVDYRLLNRLSNLVICSRCLRNGKVTPVPQVIADRRALTNICTACRKESATRSSYRQTLGKVLRLSR